MKTWKRALALVLALVMALSLVALPSFAAGDDGTCTVTIEYQFTDGKPAANPWTAHVTKGSPLKQTVSSPNLVGYKPYLMPEAVKLAETVEIDLSAVNEDTTYTVVYKPIPVKLTINHWLQNADGTGYTLDKTETKQQLAGTPVGKGLEDTTYKGYTALLYNDEEPVALDGTTKVDIYYDRSFYLLKFDLGEGGYGVEPIYDRFDAPIGNVGTPVRPGYTFKGWDKTIPEKVPAENVTYTAQWEKSTANLTVVFWYENADDTNYSVAGTFQTTMAPGTQVTSDQYKDQNFTVRDDAHFTYQSDKGETKTVNGDGSTILNVYYSRNTYTLTFKNGQITTTCGKEAHTHTYDDKQWYGHLDYEYRYKGGCYPADSYSSTPICGKEEHTHSSRKCGLSYSDLTITAKYQQDIHSKFPILDEDNKTIWWKVPSGTSTYETGNRLGSIDIMPGENITFTNAGSTSATWLWYYVEALSGQSGDTSYSDKNFDLYKKINCDGTSNLTYKEEFHAIKGFTQWKSNPIFKENGKAEQKDNNYFYYTRNSYTLCFYNYNAMLTGKESSVQYEASLSGYKFDPQCPADLEEGAYRFEGWYTDPYFKNKVDFATAAMPAANLVLYAKWVPVNHTVRTWLTDSMKDAVNVGDTGTNVQTVPHGSLAIQPDDPTNGGYNFIGWFYKSGDKEKAFDFASMTIRRDMDIYAKWNANTLVKYVIHYVLEDNTSVQVAQDTTGSALALTNKTFEAKTGGQLNADYRTGYYPTIGSHNVTMEVTDSGVVEYTFYYRSMDNAPYTVRYLEEGTEKELHREKSVQENKAAIVTENFVPITGYVPDAASKRLVVSADVANNVITFWYTKDNENAPVQIIHWVQNVSGNGYTRYQTSAYNTKIGTTVTEAPLTLNGFHYTTAPTGNDPAYPPLASGQVTGNGLFLNLYYDRDEVTYTVRYLDKRDNSQLYEDKTGTALHGATVTETAQSVPAGYRLDSATPQQLTVIKGNENVIIFYYVPVFYVKHIQDGKDVQTDTYDVVDNFNITEKVNLDADGRDVSTGSFLYGGTFENAEGYTEVADFKDGNPTSFTPDRGKTYCIWEPDAAVYLMPKSLSGWEHIEDGSGNRKLIVNSFYLVTPVDRVNYTVVGFTANDGVDVRDTTTNMDDGEGGANPNAIYESIVLPTKSSSTVTYTPASWRLSDDDLLGCAMANKALWNDPPKEITYVPYWITLDGVKVTGAASRTYVYDEQYVETHKGLKRNGDDTPLTSTCTYVNESNNAPMRLLSAYIADSTQYTVNFHDNGVETAVTVRPGSAASCQPAGVSGKLFAGWYADADCTQPADLTAVEQDMDVYAKYVSDSYLTVKYNKIGLFRPTGVNLITAVDSENFAEVGFVINGEKIPVSDYTYRYRLIFTAGSLFGGDVARKAPMVTMDYSFNGAKSVTVAPYWVTNDGTTVTGAARTLTVSGWSIKG